MDQSPIFVAGFPKSGTTWMTRLLGDILNCPTGGFIPSEDGKEIAAEGSDRVSPYIVRKGHYHLAYREDAPEIGRDLSLNLSRLENPKIVFIVRDPRDIAISAGFYWNQPFTDTIIQMLTGSIHFRAIGSWNGYLNKWFNSKLKFALVRYEDLHLSPDTILRRTLDCLDLSEYTSRIKKAYERQTFSNRVKHIVMTKDYYNLGQEFNLRFMRSGKVGEWKKYLERKDGKLIHRSFWDLMHELNYEDNPEWWRCLP